MEELEISFQQSRLLDLFVLEGEESVAVLQTARSIDAMMKESRAEAVEGLEMEAGMVEEENQRNLASLLLCLM